MPARDDRRAPLTGSGPTIDRTRWLLHFVILCCPILLTVILYLIGHDPSIPENNVQLAKFISLEFLIWGMVFAAAFRVSGITARQLCLITSNPLRAIGYGFCWFFVIRISILIIILPESIWIDPLASWATQEKMFDITHAHDIARHPAFSFAVFGITALIAGFSEELWRVGMLRGLGGIFPQLKGKRTGTLASILFVSLVFGLGHLYQGWLGVEDAILVGFFLGLILVYRRSYWEIAIAHTLFDASAFGAIACLVLNPYLFNAQIVSSAARGDIPKIKYLIEMGGDINGAVGPRHVTPLEAAAGQPSSEMVSFLMGKGANPNMPDSNGETPLMAATEKNRLENVKLLIGRGANVNLADKEGETPLTAARRLGFVDLANLLQQNGGK